MRSEVTAEVLEKVAKLLGGDYCVNNGKLCTIEDSRYRWAYLDVSDGDLLLTILNKAAEMGYKRCTLREAEGVLVQFHRLPDWLGVWHGKADNELEAAMLAFAQLPESP